METKQRVTRDELELKLTAFQDDLKSITSDKSEKIKALIVAGASIALLLAFWLGRRSGKKRGGIVEIFSGKRRR